MVVAVFGDQFFNIGNFEAGEDIDDGDVGEMSVTQFLGLRQGGLDRQALIEFDGASLVRCLDDVSRHESLHA